MEFIQSLKVYSGPNECFIYCVRFGLSSQYVLLAWLSFYFLSVLLACFAVNFGVAIVLVGGYGLGSKIIFLVVG